MKNEPIEGYFDLMKSNPALFHNENFPFKIITNPGAIARWQDQQRTELMRSGLPTNWSDIGIVLDDPYIIMIRDLVEFPGGKRGGYIRLISRADLKGGEGIVVLPLFQEKILMLRQFRHATRSWNLEAPRGFGTIGISSEENARKEIIEEIGGELLNLIDLGYYHANTGMESSKVRLYCGNLISIGEPDRQEGIDRIMPISLSEIEDMIRDGQITDGFTIAAYTRSKLLKLI